MKLLEIKKSIEKLSSQEIGNKFELILLKIAAVHEELSTQEKASVKLKCSRVIKAYMDFFQECQEKLENQQPLDPQRFKIAVLDFLNQANQILKPSAKNRQQMILKRMEALGYPFADKGHCYGITYMGVQSFFADNMQQWNQRIKLIASIPVTEFESYEKLALYLQSRHTSLDNAHQVTEDLNELHAFFDGISLYQNMTTPEYSSLMGVSSVFQNAHLVSDIMQPRIYDDDKMVYKKPTLLHSCTNLYTPESLVTYLSLLKDHLGKASFSVVISANAHALSVHYDHDADEWLVYDPNHLGKARCINTIIAANLLMDDFNATTEPLQGIMAEANVYVEKSRQPDMQASLNKMLKSPVWTLLTNPDQKQRSMLMPLLDQKDIVGFALGLPFLPLQWIAKIILMHPNSVIEFGGSAAECQRTEVLKYINKNYPSESEFILRNYCAFHGSTTNSLPQINCLLEAGVKVTPDIINRAISEKKRDLVELLLKYSPSSSANVTTTYKRLLSDMGKTSPSSDDPSPSPK